MTGECDLGAGKHHAEADSPATLVKRRFIAGAVCPKCRAEDRLQVEYWRQGEAEYQVQCCVACGLRKEDAADSAALPALPRIRRGQQSADVPAEPVRFLDPAKPVSPERD